ncbi:unnamed protein product [Mortierella alpina]
MDDYGIALSMNNMPGIRSLSIHIDHSIGPMSLAAMTNLAANLTRFESHSPFTNSASVQLVLFSCPLLHTLIARKIPALDAIQDKQTLWPCARSLKVLCLSFAFESHETHLQDEVYMKLAGCTQLEQLIMHEPCDKNPGSFGLRLRLAQGLGRLSHLSNMPFLSTVNDFTQTPRMEEAKWMAQYWPKVLRYHCAYSGFSMVHHDFVRTLKVHDTLLHNASGDIDPARFPNLQSLTITDPSMDASTESSTHASTWASTDEAEEDSLPFEPKQPFGVQLQLKHLNLDNIQLHKIAWFLEPIAQFSYLRTLVITETKIDQEGALGLWKVLP